MVDVMRAVVFKHRCILRRNLADALSMVLRVSVFATLLATFGWWAGGVQNASFLACSVIACSLVAEVSTGANFEIVGDLKDGTLVGVKMAGRSMYVYALSQTIWQMLWVVVSVFPVSMFLTYFKGPPPISALVGCFLLLLAGSAFGVLLSILSVKFGTFRYSSLSVSVVLLFSGVFYEIDSLPSWMRGISQINPIYYLIDLVRSEWVSGRLPRGGFCGISYGGIGTVCLCVVAAMLCQMYDKKQRVVGWGS